MAHYAAAEGDAKFFESFLDRDSVEEKTLKRKTSRRLSLLLSSIIGSRSSQQHQKTTAEDPSFGFNEYGFAPIHAAAFHNHAEVIKLLTFDPSPFPLSDPNQPTKTKHHSLPLNLAISQNSRHALKQLLKSGANPWLRDGDGMDAFEMAVRCGRRRCLSVLNQYARKKSEECLGVVYGGSCYEIVDSACHSADNIKLLDCTNCDNDQDQAMNKSDSCLILAKKPNCTHHVRKTIPYGPWDVECGRVLEQDLRALSDSDIDCPTMTSTTTITSTLNNTTASLDLK